MINVIELIKNFEELDNKEKIQKLITLLDIFTNKKSFTYWIKIHLLWNEVSEDFLKQIYKLLLKICITANNIRRTTQKDSYNEKKKEEIFWWKREQQEAEDILSDLQ